MITNNLTMKIRIVAALLVFSLLFVVGDHHHRSFVLALEWASLPSMDCSQCSSVALCDCGQYSEQVSLIPFKYNCHDCNKGASCGGKSAYDCEPGHFGRGRECALIGTFSGSDACPKCPAGTWVGHSKSEGCYKCEPGQYQPSTGSTGCSLCPKGTSTNGLRQRTSSSDCQQCPPGTYGPSTGLGTCYKCPGGTVSTATGAKSIYTCEECPAGKYSSAGSTSCSTCPAGTWSAKSSPSCTKCEAGTASNKEGATVRVDCRPCPIGYYTDGEGATRCEICPAGTANPYGEAESLSWCKTCPAGQWSHRGSSKCYSCAPGTANPNAGATSSTACKACAPGFYSLVAGSANCTPCSPGWFQNATASTSVCSKCDAGYFASGYNNTACEPCAAGSFSALAGSAKCTLCRPHHFQSKSAQTSCEDECPAGSVAPDPGATACRDCGAGYISIDVEPTSTTRNRGNGGGGQTSTSITRVCQKCRVGTYSNSSRSDTCLDCNPGTFAASEGTTKCTLCEPGTFAPSPGGATECVSCGAGEYQSDSGKARCEKSPPGTFTVANASTKPELCPPGHSSPGGSKPCFECLAGTYAPAAGHPECTPCEIDSFNTENASTNCTKCPRGYTTGNAIGATSCFTVTHELTKSPEDPSATLSAPPPTLSDSRTASSVDSSESRSVPETHTPDHFLARLAAMLLASQQQNSMPVSQQTVEKASESTAVSVAGIVSQSPTSISFTRKVLAMESLKNCPLKKVDNLPPLSFDTNPTSIEIGGGNFATYRGSIIGQLIICSGAVLIAVLAVVVRMYYFNAKAGETISFWASSRRLYLPGWLAQPLAVLGPSAGTAVGALLIGGDSALDKVLAAAGLILFLVLPLLWFAWAIIRKSWSEKLAPPPPPSEEDLASKWKTFKRWAFHPREEWQESNKMRSYGRIWQSVKYPFFVIADYATQMSITVVTGSSLLCETNTCCRRSASVCVGFAAVHVAIFARYRPFLARHEQVFNGTFSGLTLTVSVFSLIGTFNPAAYDAMSPVVQACTILGLLVALVVTVSAFTDATSWVNNEDEKKKKDGDGERDDEDEDDVRGKELEVDDSQQQELLLTTNENSSRRHNKNRRRSSNSNSNSGGGDYNSSGDPLLRGATSLGSIRRELGLAGNNNNNGEPLPPPQPLSKNSLQEFNMLRKRAKEQEIAEERRKIQKQLRRIEKREKEEQARAELELRDKKNKTKSFVKVDLKTMMSEVDSLVTSPTGLFTKSKKTGGGGTAATATSLSPSFSPRNNNDDDDDVFPPLLRSFATESSKPVRGESPQLKH